MVHYANLPAGYANLPAGSPPPGVIPNFDHPQSRAYQAYIGMGVCIGVALIFMVLRIYVRLAVNHTWGWEDWSCLMGFMLLILLDTIAFTLMGPGMPIGKHMWDTKLSWFTKSFFQRSFTMAILYPASTYFVKLSLFLLYFKIFHPNKLTRWLVYGGSSICGLFYSTNIISLCVLCTPKPGQRNDAASWFSSFTKCGVQQQVITIIQSAFGTLSDIYLLVIPIQSIFQLQLPYERKVGVSAIFLIGITAIMCSLGTLAFRVKRLSSMDSSWLNIPNWVFLTAELSAGIICSCMPILPALFRKKEARKPFHFTSHNSRRPFVSNEPRSLNNSHPSESENFSPSSRNEADSDMELESGIEFVN